MSTVLVHVGSVCGIESLGLVQVTPWSSVVPAGEFESCVAEIEAGDSGRGSPLSLGIEMKKKSKRWWNDWATQTHLLSNSLS
jgi:hypothetical protein